MSVPADERVDLAIFLLEELTGGVDGSRAWLKKQFGLTKTEASVLATLNRVPGKVYSKTNLYVAVYGDASDVHDKIIDIFICKIRAKIKPLVITTFWGQGYCLNEKIEIPEVSAEPVRVVEYGVSDEGRSGTPWTKEEDDDLRVMMENGSKISVIAYEFDRTECACLDRWRTT